jgi:hypothetical protein
MELELVQPFKINKLKKKKHLTREQEKKKKKGSKSKQKTTSESTEHTQKGTLRGKIKKART